MPDEVIQSDEARARWADSLNRVQWRGESLTIIRNGRPAAVLSPLEACYLLVEDEEINVVAVGPFADIDAARAWEDSHEGRLGTVRGVVRTALPDAYLRDQNKEV